MSRVEKILTTKEAADMLKVSTQTIKNYIYHGKIKSFKTPGGHHRMLASEFMKGIDRLIEEHSSEIQMEQPHIRIIKAFLRLLEKTNSLPCGHSERVSNYVGILCDAMGMEPSEKSRLQLAGLLHDVGKMGISEKILSKPGKLTFEEFSVMKQHPEIGERIVKDIDVLETTGSAIRHHHERFDGKGYPDGIAGNNIPLGARIISVAEVYDVLTSWIVYRSPFSSDDACSELRRVSGSQLDSEVVNVFVNSQCNKKGAKYIV